MSILGSLRRRAGAALRRKNGSKRGPARPAEMRYAIFRDRHSAGFSASTQSGTSVCQGLTFFHDGAPNAILWQQTADLGLKFTVYRFGGSYVSLAAGVDTNMCTALGPGRRLRAEINLSATRPLTAFLRLNMETSAGHETFHETIIVHQGRRLTDFYLDGGSGDLSAVKSAWLDMIISDPVMSEFEFHDLKLEAMTA